MRYPTYSEYAESILNPEGRFRTLSDIRSAAGDHSATGSGHFNFIVLAEGKRSLLRCGFRNPCLIQELVMQKLSAMPGVRSPGYLSAVRFLEREIYVFDSAGNGEWYDVILEEIPDGVTLADFITGLPGCGRRTAFEVLDNFLLFAVDVIRSAAFRHNNLKASNIFITSSGEVKITDYRAVSLPDKVCGTGVCPDPVALASLSLLLFGAVSDPHHCPYLSCGALSDTATVAGYAVEYFSDAGNKVLQDIASFVRRGSGEIAVGLLVSQLQSLVECKPLFSFGTGGVDIAGSETLPLPAEYESIGVFREGLACAVNDGRYGFVDESGKVIIPLIYDWAGDFEEGLVIIRSGNNQGILDKNGAEILPLIYEDISWVADNGVILACEDGKWRFYNREGEVISPCTFDNIGDFSCNLAWVRKHNKYGYVDRVGMTVIPVVYDNASSFNTNGFATVELAGERYLIDLSGEIHEITSV